MKQIIKRIIAKLPFQWQNELKRIYFWYQIKNDKFVTNEPEYSILEKFISLGDWVIDIGANVGHYTKRFSEIVGPTGRVIAFEPVPETFFLLSANIQNFLQANITLFNVAVSDKTGIAGMSIPRFNTGLINFYRAHLSDDTDSDLKILTMKLDSLKLANRISLIKIDAEGHEESILKGIRELLLLDRPTLIIETESVTVLNDLQNLGYSGQRIEGSPNTIFQYKE